MSLNVNTVKKNNSIHFKFAFDIGTYDQNCKGLPCTSFVYFVTDDCINGKLSGLSNQSGNLFYENFE